LRSRSRAGLRPPDPNWSSAPPLRLWQVWPGGGSFPRSEDETLTTGRADGQSQRPDCFDLTMESDGSDVVQVTYPRPGVLHTRVRLGVRSVDSVSLRRSVRDNPWLVHPDGTDLHRLTTNPHHKFEQASSSFSPDGTVIGRTGPASTTSPPTREAGSKTGRAVVAARAPTRLPASRPQRSAAAIFTIRADVTGARRTTPWTRKLAALPDWSPDGRWILFVAQVEAGQKRSLDGPSQRVGAP
jgi:WD40-like Beta Propeller Repeat